MYTFVCDLCKRACEYGRWENVAILISNHKKLRANNMITVTVNQIILYNDMVVRYLDTNYHSYESHTVIILVMPFLLPCPSRNKNIRVK